MGVGGVGGVDDVDVVDIPFEFVGEIAGSSTVAKAGHVERLAAARHGRRITSRRRLPSDSVEEGRPMKRSQKMQ